MKVIYDNEPSVLEAVGNGSHRYHYDIKAVKTESAEKSSGAESRTQYECQEVIVWEPLTSNKITEAVIADKWDGNKEQKLINGIMLFSWALLPIRQRLLVRLLLTRNFLQSEYA